MFINCPHCNALVATDPATDLPPARCPRCASVLRETQAGREDANPRSESVADTSPDTGAASGIASGSGASLGMDAHHAEDAAHADHTGHGSVPDTGSDAAAPAVGDDAEIPAIQADTVALTDVTATATDVATSVQQIERMPSTASGSADEPSAQVPVEDSAQAAATTVHTAMPGSDNASTATDVADANVAIDIPAVPPASTSAEDSSPATIQPITAPRRDKAAPSFVRARAPLVAANARRRWALPSLIAGLSLLLALQWVLADRARLAADAGWRPFVTQLCATLRCGVPPWREPSAFALLERDIRPHPTVPGALRVTATFRNDAQWPQPWPEVVLTLSDVDGRAIGARAFAATEYLGAAPTQNALSRGQTAAIRMDVIEPSPRSVAFAFDFR